MKVDAALAVVRRRLRTEAGLRVAYAGATCGSVAAFVVLLASRVVSSLPDSAWLLALPIAAFLLGFVAGYVRRVPSAGEVAAALDVRLDLRERVSTAQYVREAGDELGDAAEFIQTQALRCLDHKTAADVKRAFRLPRDYAPGAAFGAVLVLFVALPWLPKHATAAPNPEMEARRDAATQSRRVKESARRLEERATEIERAAEIHQLEEARRLARELRTEANRMAASPPQLKDALKSLAVLELTLKRAQADAFGLEAGELGDETAERLSELARDLDQLDPQGLSLDLDAFKQQARLETERAAASGSSATVDQRGLRDLMRRLQEMTEQLEALREAAAEELAEYESLSQEQLDTLAKLQKALEDLESRLGAANAGGRPLDADELKELLDQLGSLSADELERMLKALREADVLEAALRAVGECRGGCSGGSGALSDAELSAMLRRIGAGRSGGAGTGRGANEPGPGMGGAGTGAGGQARRGTDDGRGEDPERVRGRIDPTGKLGRAVPFQGVPNPAEAKREFDETIGRAAAAAEEGLGKDLIPPDARAYVRRYFEALRDQK